MRNKLFRINEIICLTVGVIVFIIMLCFSITSKNTGVIIATCFEPIVMTIILHYGNILTISHQVTYIGGTNYSIIKEDLTDILNLYLTLDEKQFKIAQNKLVDKYKLYNKTELDMVIKMLTHSFIDTQLRILCDMLDKDSSEFKNAEYWTNRLKNNDPYNRFQRYKRNR